MGLIGSSFSSCLIIPIKSLKGIIINRFYVSVIHSHDNIVLQSWFPCSCYCSWTWMWYVWMWQQNGVGWMEVMGSTNICQQWWNTSPKFLNERLQSLFTPSNLSRISLSLSLFLPIYCIYLYLFLYIVPIYICSYLLYLSIFVPIYSIYLYLFLSIVSISICSYLLCLCPYPNRLNCLCPFWPFNVIISVSINI